MKTCVIVFLTCEPLSLHSDILQLMQPSNRRDDSTYYYFQNKSRRSATSDTNETHINTRLSYVHDTRSPVPRLTPDYPPHSPISFEEDRKNERLIHAMKLLLAARDRVLSLSEQRVCVSVLIL